MGSQIMFPLLMSEQQSSSLDEACPNYWKIITFAGSLLRSDQTSPRENYIFKGSFYNFDGFKGQLISSLQLKDVF